MRKVRDSSAVPPGGKWTYVCRETGLSISHPYFNELKRRVKEHFKANNIPVGSQFNEEFEENICSRAHSEACVDFIPPSLLDKMGAAAKALARAALSGQRLLVDAAELDRRRNICAECNYYGGSRSILRVACQKCGCAGLKLSLTTSTCPHSPPKW